MMVLKIFKNLSKNKYLGSVYFQLSLILIFGLVLRLLFFSGIGTSDDLAYSRYANSVNEGSSLDSDGYFSTRLGIIYVTALSYSLFGINDYSSVLFVLLISLANIILVFYFGKLLFTRKVGLLAAFLLSFFPLDVVYSTRLLSDLPSAFFMALGVYFFLYSEKKQRLKYGLGYIFSGIFIGLGYLMRESALLIALFFVAYILYKRKVIKQYFLIPSVVLIIFLIETLTFLAITGDPLSRVHASQVTITEVFFEHNYFGRLNFPEGLFHYPWLLFTNNLLLYFYIFIFLAIGYCLIYKKKETYTLLFWFIPLLLYLSFGSSSFTQYVPFKAVDRYTSIITIPGILLLAYFLTEKNKVIKRVILPVTLIILFMTSIGVVYLQDDRNLLRNLKTTYPVLLELDKTVYIDGRSLHALDYISEYKNNIELMEYPNNFEKTKDAYVVVNKEMIRKLREAHENILFPDEISNTPKKWKLIKEIGNVDEDKILIYYIP